MSGCRIKICGITRADDALLAADLGANAVGLIFAPSPRQVAAEAAAEIVRQMPPFVSPVGVFVNESVDNIRRVAEQCGLSSVQLHGDESPEIIQELEGLNLIKAISVKDERSLAGLDTYPVNAFLFDTYSKKVRGGTGETFNWELVSTAEIPKPFILSGGLGPENIADAIRTVRPFGVDVSSGVEAEPGKKDHGKLRKLFDNIRALDD